MSETTSGLEPQPAPQSLESLFNPMAGDWILRILTRGGKVHPLRLSFVYVVLFLALSIVLSMVENNFWSVAGNKKLEFMEDYGNWLNFLFILPVGIVLIYNYYDRLRQGLIKLVSQNVVMFRGEEERVAFLTQCHKILNRNLLFWISILLSLGLNVWLVLNVKNSWNSQSLSLFALIPFRIYTFLNFAMVFYFLGKAILTVQMFRFMFRHHVVMQPLHPDRCGGLLPLGHISGAINMFLGLLTLYITVLVVIDGVPLTHPLFLSVVLGFFGLAIYLFLIPAWLAHVEMKRQKDEVLQKLNQDFQVLYTRVTGQMVNANTMPKMEEQQELENLSRFHHLVVALPTWPFNIETLSRLFAVVIGPLLVAFLKFYLEPYLDTLKKFTW